MSILPDYRDDPIAYELEEHSRPDEMRMLDRAGEVASSWLDTVRNANCLDLCCGTGLSMERLVVHPHVSEIVGVDVSAPYLAFAEDKYARLFRDGTTRVMPKLFLGDAVVHQVPRDQWDLIMLASAYHHIENDRKVQFLTRVRNLLGMRGMAVLAENVLPEYVEGQDTSYRLAVRRFYDAVLDTARRATPNLPREVEGLIEKVAEYGCDGEYEYKVSLPILRNHLQEAGLKLNHVERVWPDSDSPSSETWGNYVLTVRAI